MNQIIKILKEKIIEVSKASQQNNKEYNEEYEKVLRSLFFDDGEIEKETNVRQLEEEKQKVEELSAAKERLNKKIEKLKDKNKKLSETMENQEKEIKIYLDEKETITRKDIEENITQVTQKEDYERI